MILSNTNIWETEGPEATRSIPNALIWASALAWGRFHLNACLLLHLSTRLKLLKSTRLLVIENIEHNISFQPWRWTLNLRFIHRN